MPTKLRSKKETGAGVEASSRSDPNWGECFCKTRTRVTLKTVFRATTFPGFFRCGPIKANFGQGVVGLALKMRLDLFNYSNCFFLGGVPD